MVLYNGVSNDWSCFGMLYICFLPKPQQRSFEQMEKPHFSA